MRGWPAEAPRRPFLRCERRLRHFGVRPFDLGEGGEIILRLGSTVRDGPGVDFQVFEDTSDGSDCYEVEVEVEAGEMYRLIVPWETAGRDWYFEEYGPSTVEH